MKSIVQITNFLSEDITDGGTQREQALADFLASQGAARLVVQDESWNSAISKLRRPANLIKQISILDPEIVVLSYPSFPFYWQHKVTLYFAMSIEFILSLRKLADRQNFKIVLDIMDVPVFQYQDLGFDLQMRASTLQQFDRFIFNQPDYLWVCSESIVNLICSNYGIDKSKMIVALNGHKMNASFEDIQKGNKLKFAYAGSLNKERGINAAIDAFLASGLDAEFYLCGPQGEWIATEYTDPRLLYYGSLTDQQAINILASCDIGVIPYPEKGYYHLAFATKLPFYMSVGLPVLCSNVNETGRNIIIRNIGFVCPIECFSEGFIQVASDRARIDEWRANVKNVRNEYAWDKIYSNALGKVRQASIS